MSQNGHAPNWIKTCGKLSKLKMTGGKTKHKVSCMQHLLQTQNIVNAYKNIAEYYLNVELAARRTDIIIDVHMRWMFSEAHVSACKIYENISKSQNCEVGRFGPDSCKIVNLGLTGGDWVWPKGFKRCAFKRTRQWKQKHRKTTKHRLHRSILGGWTRRVVESNSAREVLEQFSISR